MGNSHTSHAAFWSKDQPTAPLLTSPDVKPDPPAPVSIPEPTPIVQLNQEPPGPEPLPTTDTVAESPVEAKPPSGLGTYEELHKPCKEIALQPFEGIRFTANKGLSSHFQVQHTVHLNNDKSLYKFGSTFVGTKQPSPTEAFPVMVGEMCNEGNLQAQFIHLFSDFVRVKCIAQTAGSKLKSLQLGTDIILRDSSLSVVAADPDLLNGNGMLIAHYLQAITPKLSIGSELLYQRGAMRQQAILTLAARYKTESWQMAGTLGTAGMHASFYRRANENVQVGVEMEASLKSFESVTSFAYQMDVPKMNLVFKGMLTSEWTVGSSLEKKLQPFPISLNMTATYNIRQDKVAVGLGAVLG